MFTNEIRLYQCHADHRDKPCDAVDVVQVCVLGVESGGLHGAKACLNLPTLSVSRYGIFKAVVADQDLQFRHTIGVFQQCSGDVYIFAFEEKQFVVDTFLSELEAVKQMPCFDSLGGFGIAQPEVLLDSQVVPYMSVVEILDPLLSDKLAVCDQRIDALDTEQRINLSISCARSFQLEFPRLSSMVKSSRNATPLYVTPMYVTPSIRILMLTSPNFQLVRSRLRTSPVLTGRSAGITLAIRSRLRAYPARYLWRRRKLESRSTPVGIADAILWRLTVSTIQRA